VRGNELDMGGRSTPTELYPYSTRKWTTRDARNIRGRASGRTYVDLLLS